MTSLIVANDCRSNAILIGRRSTRNDLGQLADITGDDTIIILSGNGQLAKRTALQFAIVRSNNTVLLRNFRLSGNDNATSGSNNLLIVRLINIARQSGDQQGGQDGQDDENNDEFDEGEALLVLHFTNFLEHYNSSDFSRRTSTVLLL